MPRKTAKDFHPEVLKLFDRYVHGIIGRREFLKSAAAYAVAVIPAQAEIHLGLSPRKRDPCWPGSPLALG